MKTRTKLKHFLLAKDKLIFSVTNLHYIYKQDLDYIKTLPSTDIETIWRTIGHYIYTRKNKSEGLTAQTCPWCISKKLNLIDSCEDCTYGNRHGKCYTSKSNQKHYASHYDRIKWTLKDNNINHIELLSNNLFKEVYGRLDNE